MSGPPLPPTDRIVFALWRMGDVKASATFALSALARGDREQTALRAQLERLRAGQALDAPAQEATLDEGLLAALVETSRYHEASLVLDAAGLGHTPTGRRLRPLLGEILAAFPDAADASFAAVLHLIRAGQAASALRALDEVVRESGRSAPKWLTARHRALAALVRGHWKHGPTPVEEVTRDTVLGLLRRRDLVGALEAARQAASRDTSARELANVLERLVTNTERVFQESQPDMDDPATQPMEGHPLCEFQIRMGVLSQADRGYRAILRDHPDDDRARSQLADVIALRQALGENPEPMPQRQASVSWLSKNAPRARAGGWQSGAGAPPADSDRDEESTDVLEAFQEAELLLKLGKAQQALDMYRILAIRHPKQQTYRKRIGEIEALIAQRGVPTSAEVTLKHDLGDLSRTAIPTNPEVKLPDRERVHPRFGLDDEEWSTLIDKIPEDLRFLGDDDPEE